jgi:signal transduction histidine kinase
LFGRADLAWPDAMVSDRAVRFLPRAMLIVSVVICAATAPTISGWPGFGVLLALAAASGAWFEWWIRWDLTPISRCVIAFWVQWLLMAAMVWINPFAAFYTFIGYLLAGTLFSGWRQVLGVFAIAALVAGSQTGGRAWVVDNLPLYLGLLVINFLIALSFVTLSNRREDAIRRRDEATRELVATQQANLDLQEQLVEQARVTGVHDERARLARDLHDTVAQGLVAVITQLESIDEKDLVGDSGRRVNSAKELARQSLSEARRAVHALGSTDLDRRALPDALRAIVSGWAAHHQIRVQVKSSGEQRASRSDTDLIRVCQEALSNVAQHAGARTAAITLTYLDDRVFMDIRDDGIGFDPAALQAPGVHGGHGLGGMQDRLELAGGELVIESRPGAGCVVSAAMPL